MFGVLLASLWLAPAGSAQSAPASNGGAASGVGTGTAPTATPVATPTAPLSPVTARSPSLAYGGPVYQLLPGGQVTPYVPVTTTPGAASPSGGAAAAASAAPAPLLLVPGLRARVINGQAAAPMGAPLGVKYAIWVANQIIGRPYVFGGGHASFLSSGYDCSGTVSYLLHGDSLLSSPLDSSQFMGWGARGFGQWITIFTNPGHAYVDVAGLRLDTSAADDPSQQSGPRWRPLRHANRGFVARHPLAL